jgi:hypothetical protein
LKAALWPWADTWYSPSPDNRIHELEKAGALIAAEIDRLLRLENKEEVTRRKQGGVKMEAFVVLFVAYALGILLPGLIVGAVGEDVFNYSLAAGMFLWPLMLCALLLYGIYTLIRAVVRTFRNT